LLTVALLGTAIDLASKAWAFSTIAQHPVTINRDQVLNAQHLAQFIPPHPPRVLIPNVLELTLVLNSGAVFGLGAGARWFFVAFTLAAVAFVIWAFATQTTRNQHLTHISAALLIAGGLGNLYDRLRFACVRDFLHPLPHANIPFSTRPLWPYVSNIADAFLILGIAGLLLFSLKRPRTTTHNPDKHSPNQTPDTPIPNTPS